MTEENQSEKQPISVTVGSTKKKNPWMYSTVAMVVLLAAVVAFSFGMGSTGMVVSNQLSAEDAANKAIDFINSNLLSAGASAELVSVEDDQDLYKVKLEVSGQAYDSYVTKDGTLFFTSGISLDETIETPETTTTTLPQAVKSDKPEAHAFVMSYCPYGLQFTKAYVPVMELLGDKANLELNFVSYIMHGEKEIDENNRMYCIQKEYKSKFPAYLRCFVGSDDPETCMAEGEIDSARIESCIRTTDVEFKITELYNDQSTWSGGKYPQYPVDATMNEQFGVRGSPTFVVNGQVMSVSRSSEAIKQAVCAAFNTPPEECNQVLSTAQEAPGLGAIGDSSGSAGGSATCG